MLRRGLPWTKVWCVYRVSSEVIVRDVLIQHPSWTTPSPPPPIHVVRPPPVAHLHQLNYLLASVGFKATMIHDTSILEFFTFASFWTNGVIWKFNVFVDQENPHSAFFRVGHSCCRCFIQLPTLRRHLMIGQC